ncbi:MAG: hypothetical protein QXI12_05200 [Candidatus Methanomethyliaceae archaeon]
MLDRLVEENQFLTCYIPVTNRAFVFRVKSVVNKTSPVLNYGPLPTRVDEVLPTFDGGSSSVPANGVLPARTYTPTGKTFPMLGAYDESDMWYLSEDDRDRVFHVVQYITPAFIRCDLQIPTGVTQGRLQKDRIITGVEKDFGFSRGIIETVHLPRIHYGYRYANDTNISVITNAKFYYGEYIIETPRNPDLIFDVLTRRIQSKWVTVPINVMDISISSALNKTYGIQGFTVYRQDQRNDAIKEYNDLLGKVMV